MEILLVTVFFVTYAAITLEHQTGVNKSAPALIGAVVLWAIMPLALATCHWSPSN